MTEKERRKIRESIDSMCKKGQHKWALVILPSEDPMKSLQEKFNTKLSKNKINTYRCLKCKCLCFAYKWPAL